MMPKGFYHTEETRQKISKTLMGNHHTLGHKLSEEHRQKISQGLIGTHNFLGHLHTEETKQKMSAIRKGRPGWNKGIPNSEECRKKISKSLIGNKNRLGIPQTEETKKKCSQPGNLNGNWKGGKYRCLDGYLMIYSPGHPRARNGRYVCEHLLIAEKALGRPLVLGRELVHHINGNPLDNRNRNLLICSKSYHYWLHARMSQLYQKEHFDRTTDPEGNIPPEAVEAGR